jgi:uncharacterized membrane protein
MNRVSNLTGQYQRPWLRAVAIAIGTLSLAGLVVPGRTSDILLGSAMTLLIATPLLRVVWVIYRVAKEGDRRFALVGVALLSAVALGVLVSLFLRG